MHRIRGIAGGALLGLFACVTGLGGLLMDGAVRRACAEAPVAGQKYDLLLRGGHVIDPKNGLDGKYDVAIHDRKIAAVAERIDPSAARKSIDVAGFHVTPGLIDIHVHIFIRFGEWDSFAGRVSIHPDTFTFRSGVTTVADAGCAGWRNFEEFEKRVVRKSRTRILAFLNIVGGGMRGLDTEQDLDDMQPKPTAEMALRHKDVIVGIKTAHYWGPGFVPVERAVEAGALADIPVMVDFGFASPERNLEILMAEKMRPGDIYTHVFSGLRGELTADGRPNPGLIEGRERGVLFDVGHGGRSFAWRVAVPIIDAGIVPDTISTDMHTGSINGGMKDMLNVMGKFLAMGMPLDEVILRATWNPARVIKREHLGNLSVGSPADVAVLKLDKGKFGFLDSYGARLRADRKLTCEMTLRAGRVVYELNGLSRPDWQTLPEGYLGTGDRRWDGVTRDRRKGRRRPRPVRRPAPKK